MVTTGSHYYNCISSNDSVTASLEDRANTYLSVSTGSFNGDVNDNNNKDKTFYYSRTKLNNSGYSSQFDYIVLAYNSTTKTYTYDVYGDASGGGTTYTSNLVDIYAKNGCLRDSTYNRFTNLANTDVISITTPDGIVYTKDSHSGWNAATGGTWDINKSGYNSNYDKITNVPIDSKVVLRTTLSNSKFRTVNSVDEGFWQTHYLKAYSFNGYTYQLHNAGEAKNVMTGENVTAQYYEETWTVKAINTANMKTRTYQNNTVATVEITPIYYLKDNTYTKTFFIDGYEGVLSEKWGTMLAVYPYYKSSSNRANAFGGYPGQPMLYWGGKFQMEIPLTVDGTATGKEVKGLTMHNAYWDLLHRKLDTKCDDGHCQTYDYDDFYKIYKEKNADTIFFRYKYYPKDAYGNLAAGHDNYGDGYRYDDFTIAGSSAQQASKYAGSGYNGVEIVTDFYGNQIDAFGTILTDSQKSHYGEESGGTTVGQTKELLFVSTGYKNTYVGHYATIWAVYAPSDGFTNGGDTANKFIGYISSSMLYLNSIDRVKQYADGTNTGTGKMSWSSFKNTYNHLKEYYEGVPALISYEKELHNDTLDKADRSDGKWYYSTTGDRITANIKIQTTSATENVTLLGDHSWTDSPFTAPGAGNVNNTDTNGNSAYFTNTTPEYLYGQVTATNILADPSQQFNFCATSGNGWEFVGWIRYSDGKYYEIADKDGLGSSNISANDTYIARFKQAVKGSLVISHNTLTDSTYKGGGTKELKVEVMNGDTVVKTYPVKTDGSDIDVSSYINSNYSSYKLRITLTTVPDEDCWVATRTVSLGADSKYDKYRTDTSSASITPAAELSKGVTYTNVILIDISDVYDATNGVTALRYTTKLKKDAINYAYRIVYTYTSRFWGDQNYTVEGIIDELQAAKYFSGVKTTATLNKDFIIASTPYEKNFRQKIDWNYNSMTNNPAGEKQAEAVVINGTSNDNVYLMTAAVGSTNTVDDVVRAEFFLPYKYDETTKASTGLDLYDSNDKKIEGRTEIAFDESSYESSTVKSHAGHLFDYLNENPAIPGPKSTTEDYNLVVAAPYVYKGLGADDFIYEYRDSVTAYDGRFTYTTDTTEHVLESTDTVALAQWYINPTSTEWFDGSTDASKSYAKIIGEGDNAKLYVQYSSTDEDNVTTYNYVEVSRTKVKVGIKQASLANPGVEKKYFTRWDIFTADGDYVSSSFAKSRAFNYSGYEDYMVIPVYESANQTYYTNGEGISIPLSELVSTTITNLGDTRNQWNNGGLGYYKTGSEYSAGSNDCNNKGDKLMVDFALAYNNKGTKINLEQQKVGLVIERLHKLDTTADNEGAPVAVTELGQAKAITDLSYYAKKYNTSGANEYCYNPEYTANYVKAKIQNTAVTANSSRPNCLNAYFKTASKLDNFDRVQYTYTFTETNDNSDHTGQALYVYRATSYIYVNGEVTLSDPIYFTLYELASR